MDDSRNVVIKNYAVLKTSCSQTSSKKRLWAITLKDTELTLLLSDLVKLMPQLFIVSLILCSQILTFFQQPTNMCDIALHLTDKKI